MTPFTKPKICPDCGAEHENEDIDCCDDCWEESNRDDDEPYEEEDNE